MRIMPSTTWRSRTWSPLRLGAVVFPVTLVLLLVRFLVPRRIGMADNGDGWRLLCRLGVSEQGRPLEKFVRFSYDTGPTCGSTYVSSQFWLDRFAQWIGKALGQGNSFNLIIAGVLGCVLAAAGVTAVVIALPLSTRNKLIAGFVMGLVVADSAFFGYFASVLSEGAAFLGVLGIAGGLLLMYREGRLRYLGAVVTVVGALIGVNAKSQTLLIVPPLVLALLLVHPAGRRGLARWGVPAIVLVAVAAGSLVLQSKGDPANDEYRETNVYHTIFDSIVDGKHDTNADLAALGLPESFSQYIGTTWWSPKTGHDDPLYAQYRDKISRRNVAHYFLTHPVRTIQIMDQAAEDMLTGRPANLGSFGEGSGQAPLSKEYRVPVFSGLAALLAPLGLYLLLPLWLLLAWAGIRSYRARHGRKHREIGLVVLFLLTSAIGQYVLATFGEGIEGVKHQVVTLFCTALAVAFALVGLLPRVDADTAETAVEADAEPVVPEFQPTSSG